MNNSSFGFDCRNNAGNCFLNSIFDEIEEHSYAKRYQNIFDQAIVEFVSSELLERQIKENFSNKTGALDLRTNVMKPEKALWIHHEKVPPRKKKKRAKNCIKDIDQKTRDEEKHSRTKSLIEFDRSLACSVKSLAVKKK